MKIIRVKPTQQVKDYLDILANRYGIKDKGLVADLFGIVRYSGTGLPTDERLDEMAKVVAAKIKKPEMLIGLLLKKRRIALKNVISTPLFQGLLEGKYDAIDAVEKILRSFTELHNKKQAYQCNGCKYSNSCKFAQTYSKLVMDISKVRDTDYKSLVHADCPAMPELDFVNSIEESRKFFDSLRNDDTAPETEITKSEADPNKSSKISYLQGDELKAAMMSADTDSNPDADVEPSNLQLGDDLDAQEDYEEFADMQAGGYGRGNTPSHYRFDGRYCVGVSESLVKNLSSTDFAMFDIAQKLDFLLDKHKKGKFKPTEELGKDKGQDTVKRISDVTRVLPSEHAKDDESFVIGLSRKTLSKREERNPHKKKALMYVIVDSSGSMYAGITAKLAFLSRFNMAKVFTLAIARRLNQDGGIMYWRAFSDHPGRMLTMRDDVSYTDFGKNVSNMNMIGGGTNIERTLKRVMDDINDAKDDLSKAEILLITDAEDQISEAGLKKQLARWPTNILHTLDVSGKGAQGVSWGNASSVLKKISEQYFYVDTSAGLDLENIVKSIV